MSLNRIQKLLFSEYSNFQDIVLIESPFAETTREGKGIRQVHLGLTPTKLIIARDIIQPATYANVLISADQDPDIENFELVCVYPVELVNLHVFRRYRRHTLKAHFCNDKVSYFELGGFKNRQMFWHAWCERVRFLNPEDQVSSYSETSVATSTSSSTFCMQVEKSPHFRTTLHPKANTSLTEEQQQRIHKASDIPPGTQATSEARRVCLVNRFGSGVPDNCCMPLYLAEEHYVGEGRWRQQIQSGEPVAVNPCNKQRQNVFHMVENGVCLWERTKVQAQGKWRHPRYYGFAPSGLFLHGFGPWPMTAGESQSVQVKRSVSVVTVRWQPPEPELHLPVSHCQCLCSSEHSSTDEGDDNQSWEDGCCRCEHRTLQMKKMWTAWDFDSATLAYQITLIDKDLFLQIPVIELSVLVWQKSSRNAPNIEVLIAFSHRLSCLVATEILRETAQKDRARLITKFINVAGRCNQLQNFQSCHSVLVGLQSPPVYRLHRTWAYVRQHHATKYRKFKKLCQRYCDTRLPSYQRAFYRASVNPPYLPFIGDLLGQLLGRVPEVSNCFTKPSLENANVDMKEDTNYLHREKFSLWKNGENPKVNKSSLPHMTRQFLSAFQICQSHLQLSDIKTPCNDPTFSQNHKNNKNMSYTSEGMLSRQLKRPDLFSEPVIMSKDVKVWLLHKVSVLLTRCQRAALSYAFCQNESAWEFLLKAHCRGEKENFFSSFELEPRNK